MKILIVAALVVLGIYGAVILTFLVLGLLGGHYGFRRCFRCARPVWMHRKQRAVARTFRVIFCDACMPVGDQLASVAGDVRDQQRREAIARSLNGAED